MRFSATFSLCVFCLFVGCTEIATTNASDHHEELTRKSFDQGVQNRILSHSDCIMDAFETLVPPRLQQGLLPVFFDDYYTRECTSQAEDLRQYAREGFLALGLGNEDAAEKFSQTLVKSSSRMAIDTMWIYALPE